MLDSKKILFITIEELMQNIHVSDEFEEVTEGKDPTKVDFEKFNDKVRNVIAGGNFTTADVVLRETTIKSRLLTPLSTAGEWEFE